MVTFTCKHHHVLEVALDFVPSAEIEEEGEWVNVERPSNKYGKLMFWLRSCDLYTVNVPTEGHGDSVTSPCQSQCKNIKTQSL